MKVDPDAAEGRRRNDNPDRSLQRREFERCALRKIGTYEAFVPFIAREN